MFPQSTPVFRSIRRTIPKCTSRLWSYTGKRDKVDSILVAQNSKGRNHPLNVQAESGDVNSWSLFWNNEWSLAWASVLFHFRVVALNADVFSSGVLPKAGITRHWAGPSGMMFLRPRLHIPSWQSAWCTFWCSSNRDACQTMCPLDWLSCGDWRQIEGMQWFSSSAEPSASGTVTASEIWDADVLKRVCLFHFKGWY